MRYLLLTLVAFALLLLAGPAAAYPPAAVDNVTRDSARITSLDCGTQYRMTLEEGSGGVFGSATTQLFSTTACPDTTITAGHTGTTTETTASFAFSSEAGASFECRLDGGAWAACTSPKDYSGVALGDHTFEVRATVAGQTDPTPASRSWTVVAPPEPPPATDPLRLSFEPLRSPDRNLEGASFADSTPVCVYLSNDPQKTGPVTFYLDGVKKRDEGNPPWDFFGGSATACTLDTFTAGTHTIKATWVSDADPAPNEDSSTFTVSTSESPPPPPPPTGTGDYPDGFPDASNTGPTGTLTPRSGGITINTPGTVFQNQDVAGHVHVTASNVTVRNVKVTSGSPWPTRIYTPTGGTKPQNVVFENVEIDCNGAAAVDAAIGDTGLNSVFRRMDIHECEDGIDPADGALIEDSFMHNFQDPDAPHFDGVQCTGGEEHVTVRHNTLDNQQDQTSAMLCKADLSCCINDILVENNFLNGGGFTFYSRAGNCCPAPTNVRLLNNWFGGAPGVFAHGTRWGATFGNCSIDGTITKLSNRYWPSGTPIDRC